MIESTIAPGRSIRSLRLARGWTQRQLADRASISLEAVWTIENGRKHPRASTVGLLATALGVDRADIAGPGRPRAGRQRSRRAYWSERG